MKVRRSCFCCFRTLNMDANRGIKSNETNQETCKTHTHTRTHSHTHTHTHIHTHTHTHTHTHDADSTHNAAFRCKKCNLFVHQQIVHHFINFLPCRLAKRLKSFMSIFHVDLSSDPVVPNGAAARGARHRLPHRVLQVSACRCRRKFPLHLICEASSDKTLDPLPRISDGQTQLIPTILNQLPSTEAHLFVDIVPG